MITTDKVTEIFCILDEFCKNLDAELTKNLHIAPIDEGYKRMRNRKGQMSKSEIMTILLCYHFGSFRNFKHYYLFFIKEHLASYFPKTVSYTRFVELMPRVFSELTAFMVIVFRVYSQPTLCVDHSQVVYALARHAGIRHRWRAVWLCHNQRVWQSRRMVDLRHLWFLGRIAPRYVCFPAGLLLSRVFRKRKVSGAFWWCALIIVAVTVPPRLGGVSQIWANGIYEALCVLLVFPLVKHMPMHTLGAFL